MPDRHQARSDRATRRWDRAFEALAAAPRRRLVAALLDAGGDPVPLPDAARAPDPGSDPEHLRLELRHCHLPLLSDAGYVEWDRSPFRAARAARFEELEAVVGGLRTNVGAIPDRMADGWLVLECD